MKQFWQAIAILAGTTVGAGILGIPYVVSQSGYLLGLIEIIAIGLLMMVINLYVAETALRTPGKHQLTGLAERYLGKKGKIIMTIVTTFGIYGAMLAYLIGQSQVLSSIFGGNPAIYGIVYFAIMAGIIYAGLDLVEKADMFIIFANILLIGVISVLSFSKTNALNLLTFNPSNLLVPYGVILFSYLATISIPELKLALETHHHQIKKAVILGTLIPMIIYILFTTAVVGVVGFDKFSSLSPNERVATIALGKYVPGSIALVANLFAFFAMSTAFISLGLALKDTYHLDHKLKKGLAWGLTAFVPFAIWLVNTFVKELTDFIYTLNVVGVISGGLTGIMVVLMVWKARKIGRREPEFKIGRSRLLGYLLIAIFALGMVYELSRIIFA